MKIYLGYRDVTGAARVIVSDGDIGGPLHPRFDLANHSPTGFEWSYGGSGPAQLALAILADALGNDARALRFYQVFKWRVIARIPHDDVWQMAQADVIRTVDEIADSRIGPVR
jgi:uncharacterized protein DUF6166